MSASAPLLDPQVLESITGLSLVARRVVEGALHGLHRSPLHGLSIEFAQHREYSPGDELKHLDWKVIGRSDRYVVKQYQQETNLRAMLVLDSSGSMAFGGDAPPVPAAVANGNGAEAPSHLASAHADASKFHYARVVAAALAYLLIQQGDSVGLMLSDQQATRTIAPSAKPSQILSICQVLQAAQPSGATDLPTVLGQLAASLRRRSLVVVLSDLFDDPEPVLNALGRLHHAGHEVVVFQVLDPCEISFDLGAAGRGVTVLRDMETGAEFETEPHLVGELVRAEITRFLEQIDAGCQRHGLHLQLCPTDVPVQQMLTGYLHYRLRSKKHQARGMAQGPRPVT